VDELLSNALLHAYPPDAVGSVSMGALAGDGVLTVTVAGERLPTPRAFG
jgi:two-component sensor histidine kinase